MLDDTIDWTVRCDWLQVASSRMILYTHSTMLMGAAILAVFLASFILVVIWVLQLRVGGA